MVDGRSLKGYWVKVECGYLLRKFYGQVFDLDFDFDCRCSDLG